MNKTLKIRPYARLLTMLGEQLIKNEQIALAELIKNSYDADADWVKVSFVNFGYDEKKKDIFKTPDSKIIIEDNGCGMGMDVIEDSWMNPATPNKKTRENEEIKTTPKKYRIIQGEKGIGRFAILKLGRNIKITTRPEGQNTEYVIDYNLSQYDDDFLTETEKGEDGKDKIIEKKIYIDNISIPVSEQNPIYLVKRILSFSLRKLSIKKWNDIKDCRCGRLLPPFITKIQQKYSSYIQRQGLPSIPKEAIK